MTACKAGHLDEFPWQAWIGCQCETPRMTLKQSGGAGLANFKVRCDSCGKVKGLRGALGEDSLGVCHGERPWLLGAEQEACDESLQGVLRNSSNTYFPDVVSSVYVPPDASGAPPKLVEHLMSEDFSMTLGILRQLPEPQRLETLIQYGDGFVRDHSREQVDAAMKLVLADREVASVAASSEVDYRQREYDILRSTVVHERLRVRVAPSENYEAAVRTSGIAAISLVDQLVVTKALAGFSRVLPRAYSGGDEGARLLWKELPQRKHRWLPAVQVRGEGILITLEESRLHAWEARDSVRTRYATVIGSAEEARFAPHQIAEFSPRLFLLHTLSHLVDQPTRVPRRLLGRIPRGAHLLPSTGR